MEKRKWCQHCFSKWTFRVLSNVLKLGPNYWEEEAGELAILSQWNVMLFTHIRLENGVLYSLQKKLAKQYFEQHFTSVFCQKNHPLSQIDNKCLKKPKDLFLHFRTQALLWTGEIF